MIETQQWEYFTCFMYAHADNEGALDYYLRTYPGGKPERYSPESMVPGLNGLGKQGWELVHMQPIGAVGKNHDVGFVAGEVQPRWSNSYFCVFKRPKL